MKNQDGFTLIEVLLTVVIMAIASLGLTVPLVGFSSQVERASTIQTMDQYGNDVIETLTHDLRNAHDVSILRDNRFTLKFNELEESSWKLSRGQILINNRTWFEHNPQLFQIKSLKLAQSGDPGRSARFNEATYYLTLILKTTDGYEKTYNSDVYLINKNL